MSLNDQQRKFYENTLAVTRQEMDELDRAIEEELAKVKDRLAELQNAKKASRQMYDCLLYTSPSPRDRQKSRMPSSA